MLALGKARCEAKIWLSESNRGTEVDLAHIAAQSKSALLSPSNLKNAFLAEFVNHLDKVMGRDLIDAADLLCRRVTPITRCAQKQPDAQRIFRALG